MEWLLSPSSAGIIDFPTYLLGTLFTILFPGPNSLYVLTITAQKGWRSGAWAAIGIFIGDSVLMIGVALGAATLLVSSPTIFNIVRTLGAIYLAYLGMGLVRGGKMRWSTADGSKHSEAVTQGFIIGLHPFIIALALSLTNPKAIFFFVAFFAQFVRPDFAYPIHTFLYLACVLQLMSMTYLTALIYTGQMFLRFFQERPRWKAVLWIFVGLLLIAFAVRLFL
jgi:leucine efflux protein